MAKKGEKKKAAPKKKAKPKGGGKKGKPHGRPPKDKARESARDEEPFWLRRLRRLQREHRKPTDRTIPGAPDLSTTMADPEDRMLRHRPRARGCPQCGSKIAPALLMKRGGYRLYRCRDRGCRHRWEEGC